MIQSSNFACGLKVRDTKPENEKCVKRGHGLSHVTYFFKFRDPLVPLIGGVSYLIYISMRHYILTTSGDVVLCFYTAVCLGC